MTFEFNKNIEILYGLSYCINIENNKLKLYNTKENNELFDCFYSIYNENITEEIKEKIISIGHYHRLAIYALENQKIDFLDISIFDEYFSKLNIISDKVINDIKNKNGVNKINLDKLKKFYGFNLSDNIVIVLSMFISGGFGIYANNSSNIVLGIKYNKEKKQYGVCGTAVCKLYHEFSHPYIHKLIDEYKLKLEDGDNPKSEAYQGGDLTEETLVRTMEIIFSYEIFGNDYLKWAIDEQKKAGFTNVGKFVNIYFENGDSISNFNDFIEILVNIKLLEKGDDSNE